MGRMVRKQMYLDETTDEELARRAEELGVSQAEVMRRALDDFLFGTQLKRGEAAAAALREMWAEADAYGIGSGGRRWTRDELYERGSE